MDSLPEAQGIRALHAPDLGPMIVILKKYLGEWLGGPKHYSSERGHPMLRVRHRLLSSATQNVTPGCTA